MPEPILIEVDPTCIEGVVINRSRDRRFRFALSGLGLPHRVKRGRWHEWVIPVSEHPTVTLMSAFHTEGFEAERCHAHLEQYYARRGLSSGESREKAARKLDTYVRRYELLADSYQRHGYLSGQAEEEVGVAIGPEGQLFKASQGQHRFGLALVLQLPSIVAEVQYVHAEWWRRHRGDFRSILDSSGSVIGQRYPCQRA